MRQVEHANEADYFIIGVVVGVLKLEEGNFDVKIDRSANTIAYWFWSKQVHLEGDLHIVETLIKNHFDDNIRCSASPNLRTFYIVISRTPKNTEEKVCKK